MELVLDNSEGRIPVESSEVRLRRTITLKKDEYSLERKHVTKTEVVNLLESAGFSRANPYYIVQQGKIRDLAVMTDKNRLELLKEVGGTKIYEERRKESLDLIEDAKAKKKEIQDMLTFFEDKVSELEGDKEELVSYLQLDKQRRVVEFCIFDRDLQTTNASLQSIEAQREDMVSKSNTAHEEGSRAKVDRKKAEKEIGRVNVRLDELKAEQEQLVAQKLSETEKKTAIGLELEELRMTGQDSAASHEALTVQIAEVEKDIEATKTDLNAAEGRIKAFTEQEREMETDIMQTEHRLQQLYQREGAKEKFSSKRERDDWIHKEIKEIDSILSKKEGSLETLEIQHTRASKANAEQEEEVAKYKEEMKVKEDEQSGFFLPSRSYGGQREICRAEKVALEEGEQTEKEISATSGNAKEEGRSTQCRDIQNGLNSLQRIVQQHNIKGVHGPIIELFECKDTYNTAVEATAGNVLFHVVVDSDDVATQIISHLNRGNGGRLSFIPLNRIHAPRVNYPNQYGKDVIPLLKVVKHKPIYQKAMAHVFGRTLLCRTIDLASEVALSANLNCVTLDGDQASHKGSLTGGYYEERHSKLENMKQLKEIRSTYDSLVEEAGKLKEDITGVDQMVSHSLGEIQKQEAKYNRSKSEIQSMSHNMKTLVLQIDGSKAQAVERESSMADLKTSVMQLKDKHAVLSSELGTELVSQLTEGEQDEIRA